MGEVWEAEQLSPVRRRVAVKVIKWGMDTREVLARFESERQALALMNHPAIAHVYDAGATPQGRPFFTMEFVSAVPITAYCDRFRLSTPERLELFIQVCEGVQHAHQKGIIHRDLKPSNVLVAVSDGRATPKIIDFGVAKATAQRLTEKTMFTELGQVIGTPEYMSPEQADPSALDVDTRSDLYSLGVILYELLAGALPFDPTETRKRGFEEIRRRIREEEPPRPSTRVGRLGPASTPTASNRRTDPAALVRELRGDLDWIVLKAIEKDRTRRYETAQGLAEDLRRFLEHQPVQARPPSTAYRLRKFARRHRVGVAAGALVALALVLGMAGTAVGLVRARRAEAAARRDAATARQVSDFLVQLFAVSDPGEARGNSVTAREILDRGAERIRTDLASQPEVQARMMHTMGRVYDSLGLYEAALPLVGESLERRRALLGPRHPDVAASLNSLGDLYRKKGRYTEAEPLLKEALQMREQLLGPDHGEVAHSLTNLGVLYENHGRYAEAEPLLRRALEVHARARSDEKATIPARQNLAVLLAKQARHAEAEALFKAVLETNERLLGPTHPDVGTACNNLAIVYKMQQRFADAAPLYERALQVRRRTLGERHPSVGDTLNNLGNLHLEQGDLARAEPLYREALRVYEAALGERHPSYGRTLDNLAQLYARQNRFAEAEAAYRQALTRGQSLGPRHPEVATNLFNLGELYDRQRRYREAEALYAQSLEIREQALAPDHVRLADSLHALAVLRQRTGRGAAALPLLERAFGIRARKLPAGHEDLAETQQAYAEALRRAGRAPEAERLGEQAQALRAAGQRP